MNKFTICDVGSPRQVPLRTRVSHTRMSAVPDNHHSRPPSPPLPYGTCAAASDSQHERFAVHSRRSGVAAAAAVEQPRGCQRRDPESLLAPIGEIGPQRRDTRRGRSRKSPRTGGLTRRVKRARQWAACRHFHRRARVEDLP